MALNDAALDLAGEGIAAGVSHISLHDGDPGAAGTDNVLAGGRFALTLLSTDGDLTLSAAVNASGLTPGETVAYIGFWDAAAAGNFLGSAPRTAGDATVNAAGEYTISAISIPASSS